MFFNLSPNSKVDLYHAGREKVPNPHRLSYHVQCRRVIVEQDASLPDKMRGIRGLRSAYRITSELVATTLLSYCNCAVNHGSRGHLLP